MVFATDLLRTLSDLDKYDQPVRVGFVVAKSYKGTESGELQVDLSILPPELIEGRAVVLVDDIVDTGKTLSKITEELRAWGPESIRPVVMLEKDRGRPREFPVAIAADDVGFRIPAKFVVGRGLDFDDRFRNLNRIAEYAGPRE